MAFWLLKTEPSEYSFADLVRQGKGTWDGVRNATALIHLRGMKPGDRVMVYHTGGEKACVGFAEITSRPYPDPAEDNPKLVVVDLKPLGPLARPVTLTELKAEPHMKDWELLRISRLSVMPVPPTIWKRIETLARKGTP